MDRDIGEIGLFAGIGAVGTWIAQRVLNGPDKTAELRERVIRLESRVGSEGDVGTIMHVLTAMQAQQDETQRMLRDILARLNR